MPCAQKSARKMKIYNKTSLIVGIFDLLVSIPSFYFNIWYFNLVGTLNMVVGFFNIAYASDKNLNRK